MLHYNNKMNNQKLIESVVATLFVISISLLGGHIDIQSDILTKIAQDKYLQVVLVFLMALVNVKFGMGNDLVTSVVASIVVTVIFVLIAKSKDDTSDDDSNKQKKTKRNM
jgi:hypothetical protein